MWINRNVVQRTLTLTLTLRWVNPKVTLTYEDGNPKVTLSLEKVTLSMEMVTLWRG